MKKNILLFLYLILILLFALDLGSENNFLQELQKLNNLSGKEKWENLKQYLLKVKNFGYPPSGFLRFEKNNELISVSNNIEKKGIWEIDSDDGYIFIKKAYLATTGYNMSTYRSFNIYCTQEDNKSCQIIFFIGSKYKDTKDMEEMYSSGKYFHLHPCNK